LEEMGAYSDLFEGGLYKFLSELASVLNVQRLFF